MTLSALDARPALIVVDLQAGVTKSRKAHPIDEVVDNAARLAAACRRLQLLAALGQSAQNGRRERL